MRAVVRHVQHGFTLIELMITIMVLAILATAALPSYRSFIVGQRVKNASLDAMSALTMARSEAIKRNANVDIIPNSGDWRNGWTVAAGTAILKRQSELGSGLSVTCYSGTTPGSCQTITYSGSGRLVPGSVAPYVLIADNNGVAASSVLRCIGIDPSGRPRSTRGSCI